MTEQRTVAVRCPVVIRLAFLALVACSSAPRQREPVPTVSDGDALVAAEQQLLEGDGEAAARMLRGRRLDARGLEVLGRAELAGGHLVAGKSALEAAVARAGTGRWQWQPSDVKAPSQVVFLADGRLVSMDGNGLVRFWDVTRGREVATLQAPTHQGLVVSPDGKMLVAGEGPLAVVDVTGAPRQVAELPGDQPIAFTPEGHLLVRHEHPDQLVELELPSGRELARFGGDARRIVVTGDTVATTLTEIDSTVTTWDRKRHEKLADLAVPGAIWFFDRDARGELVIGSQDNLTVGEIREGKQERFQLAIADRGVLRTLIEDPSITGAAMAPDRAHLMFTTSDGYAKLVELASGRVVKTLEVGSGTLAVHPSGKLIVVAGPDGFALWNLATGAKVAQWNGRASVRAVAFDDTGTHLAVGADSGTATIWDLAHGTQRSVTTHVNAPVEHLAFGPDGALATSSLVQREWMRGKSIDLVAVWERDGKQRWSHELEHVEWLAYRPGSDQLATASRFDSNDRSVTLWSARGTEDARLFPTSGAPYAWSSAGALAHGDGGDGIVLELGAGTARIAVAGWQVAFAPGGKLLAIGESGGRTSVWTADDQRVASVVEDESGGAEALAWSPDGSLLASAAASTVRLWDPRSSTQLARFAARAPVNAIAFHPSGRYVAVGCSDGTVELWSVATATVIATLAGLGPDRGIAMTPDGAVDGTIAVGDPLFWIAGGLALPALGAWEHARAPGLLAARLGALPADVVPRAELRTPVPPPPGCFSEDPEDRSRTLTTHAVAGNAVSLCVAPIDGGGKLPTCFTLDLASGTYHPRVATPSERLGKTEAPATTATVTHHGSDVEVCRNGACRHLAIAEAKEANIRLATNDDGTLVAAWRWGWNERTPGAVYDVAGHRVARLQTMQLIGGEREGAIEIEFLTATTLILSSTPCAGPCSTSFLVDARSGKLIAKVDVNASALEPAQLAGDVWAFNDWESAKIIYQNVRSGAVVRSFDRPVNCTQECRLYMEHVAGVGIALLPQHGDAGDVTLVDARGVVTARHHLPVCK